MKRSDLSRVTVTEAAHKNVSIHSSQTAQHVLRLGNDHNETFTSREGKLFPTCRPRGNIRPVSRGAAFNKRNRNISNSKSYFRTEDKMYSHDCSIWYTKKGRKWPRNLTKVSLVLVEGGFLVLLNTF